MGSIRQFLFSLALVTASTSAFAVDFDHVFTIDSITSKPVRSDYSSEAAFAADSLVYGIPRTCTWRTVAGGSVTKHGKVSSFQLGANLRKSADSNWYANSAKATAASSFRSFTYVNGDTGNIACGMKHLSRRGGSWTDGKWYKTFDLVLRTNKARGGSTVAAKGNSRSSSPSILGELFKIFTPSEPLQDVEDPANLERNIETLKKTNARAACYLRDAYLAGADLDRANLGGADLRGADLNGANLARAFLRGGQSYGS